MYLYVCARAGGGATHASRVRGVLWEYDCGRAGWAFLTLAPSHSTHTLFPLQYHYPGAPLLSLRFTYDRNDSLLVAAGLPALPLAESSRALLGAAEAVMAKSEGGEPGRVGSVVGSVV